MWTYERSVETNVTREAIWRQWADVENWGVWNADIDSVQVSGPFAAGTEIVMTSAGQDPVRLRITEATAGELFVDEARIGGLLLRTVHRLDRGERLRTRVMYRMEITGAAADELGPQIGPAVTADWPATMTALVDRAGG